MLFSISNRLSGGCIKEDIFMKGKRILIVILAVLVVVGGLVGFVAGSYNTLVEKQTALEARQADVQTQLQRRADLIPNFVATVKGYSDFEKATLSAVTEARAAVAGAKNGESLSAANEQLDKAISVWVNAVTEAYPELKADKNYLALQDELSGTENRIAVARRDYNAAVEEYNLSIRSFPKNILAGMFGFEKAELFSADENAQTAPSVQF